MEVPQGYPKADELLQSRTLFFNGSKFVFWYAKSYLNKQNNAEHTIGTVANSLSQNEVILLTLLI